MATGFIQRFKGKIKAAELWLDPGGKLFDAASGIAAFPAGAQKIELAVTATADTYFTASIPPGCTLLRATVYTTTAFGASTDAKIALGVSQGDATYVAATSIKALGVVALVLASGAAENMPATPNVYVEIVQTGTASATGAATLVLEYA